MRPQLPFFLLAFGPSPARRRLAVGLAAGAMEARFEALATLAETVGAEPEAQPRTLSAIAPRSLAHGAAWAGPRRATDCAETPLSWLTSPRSPAARQLAEQVAAEVCELLARSRLSYEQGRQLMQAAGAHKQAYPPCSVVCPRERPPTYAAGLVSARFCEALFPLVPLKSRWGGHP